MPSDKADGEVQVATNGDGETDPKAPLANLDDEEDIGDPVPNNVQAVLSLCGIVGAIMLAMGLTSSEWVMAVDGFYWQGIFIYCAGPGYNGTELVDSSEGGEDDGSGSGSGSGSSSASSSSEEADGSPYEVGCKRIDLENQGYTMVVALLVSISLSCNIFGLMLALLGSWVRDIDSKRKSYKLSLYLLIVCVVSCVLSLIVYTGWFGEVIENKDDLGPFKDPDNDWSVGWSFEISVTALVFQIITTLAVAYSLLLLPIIEEVEVDEEAAEK